MRHRSRPNNRPRVNRTNINNRIRVSEVKLIGEDGAQLGVVRTSSAIEMARDLGLDLVEVSANVRPPIAKIMDYGKYVYEKEKREKGTKSKRKEQSMRTVRVGYKTGDHDMKFKAKKADEFLNDDSLLKVELTLRGREKAMAHIGKEKLKGFLTLLTVPYIVQANPIRGPYGWVIMLRKDKKAPTSNKSNVLDSQPQVEIGTSKQHHDENKKSDDETHQSNSNGKDIKTSSESKPL